MEEVEKMEALKRVYADIILNTVKEAAARIMVSERKTLRFQQDLSAAKDEALNMLLRMKQIMESRIAEAEKASLSQQSRIEELELQLHEAEEIVSDLRSELKGMQDELESLKSNPEKVLNGQMAMENVTSLAEESQEDKPNSSNGILSSPPDSDCGCCSLSENEAHVEISVDSPVENCCAGNPDLASLIMQSKEPELYRNGCTQRIRAFEGNLLDGVKLPLPGHEDDQCLHIKSDEIVEGSCAVVSSNNDNIVVEEKNVAESEEVMQHDSSCDKGQANKSFQRIFNKRRRTKCKDLNYMSLADPYEPTFPVVEKSVAESEEVMQHDSSCDKGKAGKFLHRCSNKGRRTRYRNLKCRPLADCCEPLLPVEESNVAESEVVMQHCDGCDNGQAGKSVRRFSNKRRQTRCRNLKQPADSCEPAVLSNSKTSAYRITGNVECDKDPSGVAEDEAQRESESHVDSEEAVTEVVSPQNVTRNDPALMNQLVLTRMEPKAVESIEDTGSELNPDPVHVPSIDSNAKDTKPCETITAAPAQAANDRLLKYTFQRKRKKEIMSNPDENALLEKENSTKRKTVEMQNSATEPQKSSLVIESSRDSRRLAQVARQLISLSEKRWW